MRNVDIAAGTVKTDLVTPASITATGAIAAVDLSQYVGKVLVILTALNTAGATPTLALKVQDSATQDSAQADVSGAAFTGLTTGASIQTLELDADNLKKWVNIHGTIGGGSSPAYTVGACVIGRKQYQ